MGTKFNISWQFVVVFLAFGFGLAEAHEVVHTNVGYMLGGCYGDRDFNFWALCDASYNHPLSYWASLSGPIFSFLVLWAGYFLIKRAENVSDKALGVAVVFASMPFGRILTVLLHKGDEFMVMRQLFGTDDNVTVLWMITTVIILGICLVPLIAAYKSLPEKKRWLSFTSLFVGPTVAFIVVVLLGLNTLLNNGLLAEQGLIGQPIIINIWFVLCIAVTYWKRDLLKSWIT